MLDQNHETIINKIREYVQSNMSVFKMYSPVVFNDVLIFDSMKRKHVNQNRIELICNNIDDNESVLDLGCNTGYLINRLKSAKSNLALTGIDNEPQLIELCNVIKNYSDGKENFILIDIKDYIKSCLTNKIAFDNVVYMSVVGFAETLGMLQDLLAICNKRVFIEPINHEKYSVDVITEKYFEPMKKYWSVKMLGTTDYQNRFLIMVEKR